MTSILGWIIGWLLHLKYFAMFGILVVCGLGLPIPEEVTLVGSGLLVGWKEAEFLLASLACILGILAGDSIIFGLGHHYGPAFLRSRPMRFFLSPRRQKKVSRFFAKHGTKAVFFARFFAGVRIGVYAYAGSQRMFWPKFIILDLMGAIISGPTSIFLGMLAAQHLVSDRDEAARYALHLVNEFGHILIAAVLLVIAVYVTVKVLRKRRAARMAGGPPVAGEIPPSLESGPAGGASASGSRPPITMVASGSRR